jgi:DNA topoisomerase-1
MDPVPMPELKCEKSDGYFILREGASGLFLASNLFPKSRETRSPRVDELIPHRDEIDPKYHYLVDAPAADPEGNPTVVRFNRKSSEHYLISVKDGKNTSWLSRYEMGRWSEDSKDTGEER